MYTNTSSIFTQALQIHQQTKAAERAPLVIVLLQLSTEACLFGHLAQNECREDAVALVTQG